VFNGLRDVIKTGAPWRGMLNDLPPWAAVYQQAQRWPETGCCEAMVEDLRTVLHPAAGQIAQPSATLLGSRT
jgi:transposase